MIFASPAWLLALVALPLAAAAELLLTRRDRGRLAGFLARPLWGRVVQRPAEPWRFVRLGLLLVAAAAMILALARPQWGIVREKVEREGVDVVLVLDTSASMNTPDVAPNRFFLARQALLQLVTRLEGDRFALVAFEGEAYPLVPLTLDADALGLFLDTVEPGIVPAPGTSLGLGLAKGLAAFVDKDRRNKVLVLVSDGEDLEGEVEAAVRQAKEAGVVVHTVGVGSESGQPVPELDAQGRVTGYKRDADGTPVVSRLVLSTLEAIARGSGGQLFRITPQDTSLSALAAAIEGIEQKALAREFSYRRKERFQLPLAAGLVALALALVLPPPTRRRGAGSPAVARSVVRAAALSALMLVAAAATAQPRARAATAPSPAAAGSPAPAASPAAGAEGPASALDEILLRPRRATSEARGHYERGNHPRALEAFERAARIRPADRAARFNMADGLYKNGRYGEAATLFRSLADEAKSPLAAPSRFNLGNSLYQQQDFRGAVQAYRDTLREAPADEEARRNLELALQALRQQQEQQKRQQQGQNEQDQKKDDQQQRGQQQAKDQKGQASPGPGEQQRAKAPQEREDERFRQETGMPKERAMQLLDALQQNEKAEQRKLLALKRAQRKKGKDW